MRTTVRFVVIFAASFAMHISAAQAASERVLYSFCSQQRCTDGENPTGSLVNVKGTLYGTTDEGGANGNGTVFSITTGGKEKVVYSFGATPDGQHPYAGLVNVSGTLYGTTTFGGAHLVDGTAFSFDPTTGTEKVLYSFAYGTDGAYPYASLINVNGTLYGTTVNGGGTYCAGGGCGTVFSVDPTTGKEKVLHSFGNGSHGEYPWASLINVNGTLYGTASLGGGVHDEGTVFSITTGGTYKVLHTFGPDDGDSPYASLINVKGTLYGTTLYGGGLGNVFSITLSGEEKVVYNFSGTDGQFPYASLINVKGALYGTTEEGGANREGTVFSITPGGKETVVYSFNSGTDGRFPRASLINVNGTLYGTTMLGGANGEGTVFAITP